MPEAVAEPGAHVGRRAEGEQMDDLVVGEMVAVGDQGLDETHRLGGARADEDPAAARDERDGLAAVASCSL